MKKLPLYLIVLSCGFGLGVFLTPPRIVEFTQNNKNSFSLTFEDLYKYRNKDKEKTIVSNHNVKRSSNIDGNHILQVFTDEGIREHSIKIRTEEEYLYITYIEDKIEKSGIIDGNALIWDGTSMYKNSYIGTINGGIIEGRLYIERPNYHKIYYWRIFPKKQV